MIQHIILRRVSCICFLHSIYLCLFVINLLPHLFILKVSTEITIKIITFVQRKTNVYEDVIVELEFAYVWSNIFFPAIIVTNTFRVPIDASSLIRSQ